MAEHNLHRSHLTPVQDLATLYPTVVALGLSNRDRQALSELADFETLQFKSHQTCFLHENAANMPWRSLNINENQFYQYILRAFSPYVLNLWENPEFTNERIVSLTDSASCHASRRVLRLLEQNDVMLILFTVPPVSIVQASDLVSFATVKKMKPTATGEFGEAFGDEQIPKLLHAYEQRATSMTIRESFQKA
jgi:hypothetical protein